MCSHKWREINDVRVCIKCGLTITFDGKIIFDIISKNLVLIIKNL